jgi:hypothetical protein
MVKRGPVLTVMVVVDSERQRTEVLVLLLKEEKI